MKTTVESTRRIELKFLLNFHEYHSFRERLTFYASRDSHATANGKYPVLSRYYDTPDLEFFRDKLEGEYTHIKIRTRCYSRSLTASQKMFLEAKIKLNKRQMKVRIPFNCSGTAGEDGTGNHGSNSLGDHNVAASILRSGHEDLLFFEEFCSRKMLQPTCNVYYDREAFSLTSGTQKIRLNFDSNLLFLHRNEVTVKDELIESRQMLHPGTVLLEIKHNQSALPGFLQQELHGIQASLTSYSKYANSIGLLQNLTQSFGSPL